MFVYSITSTIQMNFANLNISRRMHNLKEIGKTLGLVSEFYGSNVSIFTTIFSNQILKQNSRDFDDSNFENVNLVLIYQQFKCDYIQLPSVGESWEVSLKFQSSQKWFCTFSEHLSMWEKRRASRNDFDGAAAMQRTEKRADAS